MEQQDKLSVFILEDSGERINAFSNLFVNSKMIVTNCAETAILFLNSYKFDGMNTLNPLKDVVTTQLGI